MDSVDLTPTSKHEQILHHIESLKPGSRISVRQLAKHMEVSEGTAYRAIKEAENQGLVTTKERMGTVRVERKLRQNLDKLSFLEVVEIVEGKVLGGAKGLHKLLHKFVIGAMKQDAMVRYIEASSLMIVGNRDQVHQFALDQGAGVLITGGFDTNERVKERADQLELPLISCRYDTFTVASMINRAMYDRVIKKNIILVEDIMIPREQVHVLKSHQTLKDWKKLIEQTGYSSFPVVDDAYRTLGIVAPQDMVQESDEQTLDNVMTRFPQTVTLLTSVASAAHTMAWEGLELLPVTDFSRKLLGIIYRQDVLKAMQYVQKQTHSSETFEALIWSHMEEVHKEDGSLIFTGHITPQMTNHLGTVSAGILTILMTQAAHRIAKQHKYGDLVIDHMSTYFSKPLQIDSYLEIHAKVMEMSRKYGKIEIDIHHEEAIVAKAMMMAHVIDPS
jgi:predicted transcriptional regulator